MIIQLYQMLEREIHMSAISAITFWVILSLIAMVIVCTDDLLLHQKSCLLKWRPVVHISSFGSSYTHLVPLALYNL